MRIVEEVTEYKLERGKYKEMQILCLHRVHDHTSTPDHHPTHLLLNQPVHYHTIHHLSPINSLIYTILHPPTNA